MWINQGGEEKSFTDYQNNNSDSNSNSYSNYSNRNSYTMSGGRAVNENNVESVIINDRQTRTRDLPDPPGIC